MQTFEKTPPPPQAFPGVGDMPGEPQPAPPVQEAAPVVTAVSGNVSAVSTYTALGEDAIKSLVTDAVKEALAAMPTATIPANVPLLQKLGSVKVVGWAIWIIVLVAAAATKTIPAWAGYAGSVSTVGLFVSRALVEYGINVNNPPPGTVNVPLPAARPR